jgi:protein-disulfide isomerase
VKIHHLLTSAILASGLIASTSVLATTVGSAPTTAAQTTNVTPNATAAVAPTPATVAAVVETTPAASNFSPDQVKQIQQIVHDYLISNPQVLVEASQALQKQNEQQEQQFAQTAIQQNVQTLFNDPASPVAGNVNGTVTLVEFFDYQCGHCKEMNSIVEKAVKDNANLRLVFKELPIFGDDSQFAAKAALASVKQGKYLAYHNALLAADNPLNKDKVFAVAKSVGLNVVQLKKDMDSPAIQAQLRANFKLAQALRLIGTPTFVVGNKALNQFRYIPGATSAENLQGMINDLSK